MSKQAYTDNPASDLAAVPKKIKPMSLPMLTLEVPERPGYNRHWFRGEAGRLSRALEAGYTFVEPSAVSLNNFDLAGDLDSSGNTDLGTRVSVFDKDATDAQGQPRRLYLMECPQEYYAQSMKYLEDKNDAFAAAMQAGIVGGQPQDPRDSNSRYVKTSLPDLFTRKRST